MKFIFKNKLLSPTDGSIVSDEFGNELYRVKGRLFTLRGNREIYKDGQHLYTVNGKIFNFLNKRALVYDNARNLVFTVRRNFGFANKFVIEGYKSVIVMVGGLSGWNYDVTIDGKIEGNIHKEFTFSSKDVYTVNVFDDSKADLFLSLILAIDIIQDRKNNN